MKLLPIALFGSLAILLVGSWYVVQLRERNALQARLDTNSRQVAERLDGYLARHLESIQLLGHRLMLRNAPSEPVFREIAARYHERHAGLQSLNWVDDEGVIRWVVPEVPNHSAVGFDLRKHPVAGDAFAEAGRTGRVAVTPPLELLQGGWGFAVYYRLRHGDAPLGYLNAVFRLPDVLECCVQPEERQGVAYLLHHGDELLGAFGPEPNPGPELPVAEAPVFVGDLGLTLTVVAAPHLAAAGATWVDEALLVAALLMAGALAWLLHEAMRRRRDAQLAASRYHVLLEHAPDAIAAIDAATGAFVNGNGRTYEFFAVARDELAGKGIADLSPATQPDGQPSNEAFARRVDYARNGYAPVFEWTFRIGGRDVRTEVHLVRMPNAERELLRASIRDVSEQKKLEEKLRRAQAHEAMGRLAGSVAHDFNNLLTVILGSAGLLRERVEGDERGRALLTEIESACHRAGSLTRQLLAFSRHSTLAPRVVSPNDVVEGLVALLRRLMPSNVTVATELDARSSIHIDPSQLEMALLNLVINARDAMPDGGRVCIATRDVDGEGEGGRVELVVEDNGEGMDAAVRERIFEPFFTTKGPGVGSGIGLATVQEIVQQAGGEVSVDSELGKGTRFQLRFAARAPAGAPPAPSAPEQRPAAGRKVLVVEDNRGVLDAVRRPLAAAGCEVLGAANASAALDVARSGASLDLVIADAVLPGATGASLEHEMRDIQPALPVLLITGYAEDPGELRDAAKHERTRVLAKPFSGDELLAAVRELLG